jgi:UDP-glucose 4-epimerase
MTLHSLDGLRILITGGTGSLGKVLVRRLLSAEAGRPTKVTVLSRGEAKQHSMRVTYLNREVTTDEVIYENFPRLLQFQIGDVRNYPDVAGAVRDADIVINAAAMKQVPTCEYFPDQAIMTNCLDAMNIVRAIAENDLPVNTVVGVSTRPASRSTSWA